MIAHITTSNWMANGAKRGLWETKDATVTIPDINIRLLFSESELLTLSRGQTEVCKSIDVPYFHVFGKPEKGNEIGAYELKMLLEIAETVKQQLVFGEAKREEASTMQYDIVIDAVCQSA